MDDPLTFTAGTPLPNPAAKRWPWKLLMPSTLRHNKGEETIDAAYLQSTETSKTSNTTRNSIGGWFANLSPVSAVTHRFRRRSTDIAEEQVSPRVPVLVTQEPSANTNQRNEPLRASGKGGRRPELTEEERVLIVQNWMKRKDHISAEAFVWHLNQIGIQIATRTLYQWQKDLRDDGLIMPD